MLNKIVRSPHPVEPVVGAVYREHRRTRIRLRDAPVPFENDHFGPDLVVDLRPFVEDFLDVFLGKKVKDYFIGWVFGKRGYKILSKVWILT